MKLITVFEHKELMALQTAIIVECWKHKSYGAGKRKFAKEFTPEEQETIQGLYKTFCKWHLGWRGTGIPQNHAMTIANYNLTKRAVHFFATV